MTQTNARTTGRMGLAVLALATALPAHAGNGSKDGDGPPPACLADSKAPVEMLDLRGPDARGDFQDAGGRIYISADLVPLAAASGREPGPGAFRKLSFVDVAGRPDRWQRRSGHLSNADGRGWLARDLVERGEAAVMPALLSPDCLAPLLRAEETARREARGGWAREQALRASDTAAIAARAGHFALVVGRVLSVGETDSTLYLNFGGRWSTDFTVTIPARKRNEFAAAGLDVAGLEGAAIRIRGSVRNSGGPAISVSHPAQIERLDKDGTRR
ncbi:hypothetical protein [Stappia sp.]|jgi:hypothetical protein|uniref:hypothetical protein n=1 Tax=Stappia sp. TaxID=1870903 RepID=UPI003A994EA6